MGTSLGQIIGRTLAILAAALSLGVTYNRVSPLGITLHKTAVQAPVLSGVTAAGTPAVENPGAPQPAIVPATPTATLPVIPPEMPPVRPPAIPSAIPPEVPYASLPPMPEPMHTIDTVDAPPAPRRQTHATRQTGVYQNESLPQPADSIYQHQTAPPEAAPPKQTEPVQISWADAQTLMATRGALLIDGRPTASFQAGTIPGAISLPCNDLPAVMPAFQQQVELDASLIIFCKDAECETSHFCAQTLMREYGYRNVYYLAGGYVGWQQDEVKKQMPPPAEGAP